MKKKKILILILVVLFSVLLFFLTSSFSGDITSKKHSEGCFTSELGYPLVYMNRFSEMDSFNIFYEFAVIDFLLHFLFVTFVFSLIKHRYLKLGKKYFWSWKNFGSLMIISAISAFLLLMSVLDFSNGNCPRQLTIFEIREFMWWLSVLVIAFFAIIYLIYFIIFRFYIKKRIN